MQNRPPGDELPATAFQAVRPLDIPPNDPDAPLEEDWYAREELIDRRVNREARRVFARRSYWLIVIWLLLDAAILGFQGFRFHGFNLSDIVLTTLIGGTTASVIGMFVIVLRYLFSRP